MVGGEDKAARVHLDHARRGRRPAHQQRHTGQQQRAGHHAPQYAAAPRRRDPVCIGHLDLHVGRRAGGNPSARRPPRHIPPLAPMPFS